MGPKCGFSLSGLCFFHENKMITRTRAISPQGIPNHLSSTLVFSISHSGLYSAPWGSPGSQVWRIRFAKAHSRDFILGQTSSPCLPFLSTSLHLFFSPAWEVYFSSATWPVTLASGLGFGNSHVVPGERRLQEQWSRWRLVLGWRPDPKQQRCEAMSSFASLSLVTIFLLEAHPKR